MREVSFAILMLTLLDTTAFAEKKDVTVTAADGFALKGTLYSAARTGPGVLMLHQCNADRQLYDTVAEMLSVGGYHVLTFDFRGFGASRGGAFTDLASQRQSIMDKMPSDVDAAFKFLISQPDVNATKMAIIGGSCGVNQAVQAARRQMNTVRALVLLSGGTDADGEAYIKDSKVPVFGIASEEDTDAAASIKKIMAVSTNVDSKLEMLKDAGHAAFMFAKAPDLEADIVIWLREALPVQGYSLR